MSKQSASSVLASLAVVVMATAGCLASRGESPPVHTYYFNPDGWPAAARPPDPNGPVLLVSPLQPEPGFDTPRMIYLRRRYELEYYAVNQWADVPARLILPLLVQAINRDGIWRAVVPLPSSVRGDYRLDTDGVAVQQEFLQQPSRVRVTVRAQLINQKEFRIVGMRTFEAVEDAPSEDAYGGVQAANRAIAAILNQLASWLQDCARRTPGCGR
jgi:cholesterol transport system auxiliary component